MKKDYSKNKLLIFASFYTRHRRMFFLDLICALLIAAIDLVFPMASRFALNNLLPDNMYSFFFLLMGSLIAMYALRSVFTYIVTYVGHTLGVLIEADMRQELFAHMQTLSLGFYDKNRTGSLMSRLTTDLFDVTELAHHGPEDLFISVVTIVGALIILLPINASLTFVLLALLPITILFSISQRKRMSRTSRHVKERVADINSDIESSIAGVRVSRAFANEQFEEEKFTRGNDRFRTAKREFYASMGVFNAGTEFPTNLFSVAVIAIGGYFIMKGEMNTVDVLTFSLYVSAFLQPIRKLTQFVEQYTNGMAGFSRFVEIMNEKPEIIDTANAAELTDVKGDIRFNDISFSYDDDALVLQNVNLNIRPGKTLAVVGPSGGGKTTLCHLIPRFYDVTDGSITIDGKDIRDVTLKSLRQNIGIVSQDVFLFADTIMENIRYGKLDATDEQVYAAAKLAEIYDTVMEMTYGFDTQVGERGVRLSGGQKQRISIARIFLKNPPILILDEATSSLDSVTEQKIQQSFDVLSQNRTSLIIAHRLSTIKNADEIIYVDDTGIKEAGTHDQLMAAGGHYAELYNNQFGKK